MTERQSRHLGEGGRGLLRESPRRRAHGASALRYRAVSQSFRVTGICQMQIPCQLWFTSVSHSVGCLSASWTVSSEAQSIYLLVTVLLVSILGIPASGKVMETPRRGATKKGKECLMVNLRETPRQAVRMEPHVEWALHVCTLPLPDPGAQGL